MKKFFILLVLAAVLGIWGCNSEEPAQPELGDQLDAVEYSLAIVTEVNRQHVTADCEMPDGQIHRWEFLGSGYEVGDLVYIGFDWNGTLDYLDDDVADVRRVESL